MVGVASDQCQDTDLEDLWGGGVMAMYTGQQPGAREPGPTSGARWPLAISSIDEP